VGVGVGDPQAVPRRPLELGVQFPAQVGQVRIGLGGWGFVVETP